MNLKTSRYRGDEAAPAVRLFPVCLECGVSSHSRTFFRVNRKSVSRGCGISNLLVVSRLEEASITVRVQLENSNVCQRSLQVCGVPILLR